jgi:hypothetical protein
VSQAADLEELQDPAVLHCCPDVHPCDSTGPCTEVVNLGPA